MTNKEILEKAIKKAIENGWRGEYALNKDYYIELDDDGIITGRFDITPKGKPTAKEQLRRVSIFNHDFAKALWGEDEIMWESLHREKNYEPAWQHHLQNMVIADDPIKYLGDNLDY